MNIENQHSDEFYREHGLMKDQIWISEDFDKPIDELTEYFGDENKSAPLEIS